MAHQHRLLSAWSQSGRGRALIFVALHPASLLLLLALAFAASGAQVVAGQDVSLYHSYSAQILSGRVPYRDFPLEYPPLALVPMLLPHVFAFGRPLGELAYAWVFSVQNVLLSCALLLLVLATARRALPGRLAGSIAAAYAECALLLSPLLFWRIDVFPSVLAFGAVHAVLGDSRAHSASQPWIAGGLLGLGTAAKLYPAIFLPVLGLYFVSQGRPRAAVSLGLAWTVALGSAWLPFALAAPHQLLGSFTYHHARGIQLDSVPSSGLLALSLLGLVPLHTAYHHGAWHLSTSIASSVLKASSMLLLTALVTVLVATALRLRVERRQGRPIPPELVVSGLTLVLISVLLFSNVLSPQYLLWLLPFCVLLPARAARMFLVICLLTVLLFLDSVYQQLVQLKPLPILLLTARNAALAALFGWLLVSTWTPRPESLPPREP
jgi:hypothetical protein